MSVANVSTGAEFCILQSYHPESKTSKFFIIKYNNTLMTIIKQIVDSMFDENHMLDWTHKKLSSCKLPGKVPNFELLQPPRSFIKKCTKSVPLVEFAYGFDFTLERHN